MSVNKEIQRQERYQRWANIMEFNPDLIDRLPPTQQAYLIDRVKKIQAEKELHERSTRVQERQQSQSLLQTQIEVEIDRYIQERAIAIAPEASPQLSEHFVTGIIVMFSMAVLGGGCMNIVKEMGREELAPFAAIIGGCVSGFVAEFSGKKLFVDRAMAKQYRTERDRLLAQRHEIQTRNIG